MLGARRAPAPAVGVQRLPDLRLAGAGDLRLLRHHLRRPPGADPHRDAGRLARSPAAQGLSAGWHPGGIQGCADCPAGRKAVVQLMTDQTEHVAEPTTVYSSTPNAADPYAAATDTTEGKIFNVS